MNLNTEQCKNIGIYIEEELKRFKSNKEKASFFVKILSKVIFNKNPS